MVTLACGPLVVAQAACPTCANFNPGVVAGTIGFTALSEASGLAASARNPGVLWTHNDGNVGRVWAISTNAARLATYNVNNVDDLEDIAVGPGPTSGLSYLYLGDIGGDQGTNIVRPDVQIVRIPEPPVDLAWASDPHTPNFNGRDNFTLVYPDGSYDAETLLVDPLTSDVWVVTKQTGLARFYRANLNAVPDNGTVVMEFVRSVAFHQASAGSFSADGKQMILRNEESAALWMRCDGEPLNTSLGRASLSIPVIGPPTEANGESISFLRDGTGYVTISEGSNAPVYFFRSTCPLGPQFTLALSNQTAFVGSTFQFQATAVGFPDPTYTWYLNGQLLGGQNGGSLLLANVTAANAGQYQVVAANASGSVTSTATLTVRAKPDLRITEVMSVAAASPGVPTADWWELTSFESQPVSLNGWRFNDNGGGLADPFTLGNVSIAPGESVIFVENLTVAQFKNWWGAGNLPVNLQIIPYTGAGLSLGAGGDGLRLWDNITADANNTVASVNFGAATTGASFNYNPVTQEFGALSQWGVNGVFLAASAADMGSPGRIVEAPPRPVIQVTRTGDQLRIHFEAVGGRRYRLEVREDFNAPAWSATDDSLQPATSGPVFFEREVNEGAQFFRVVAE